MEKSIDRLIGKKFNLLTVVCLYKLNKYPYSLFVCKCDCGNSIIKSQRNLMRAKNSSCGCFKIRTVLKHGECNDNKQSLEYRTWTGIKDRCFNPRHKSYKNYGGRGISICNEWKHNFMQFLEDMGRKPSGASRTNSIERIDNNKGYYKENCIWSTPQKQAINRRNNFFVYYNGENLTLSQWAKKVKISRFTIRERLNRGWSIEKTLTLPVRYR